MSPALSGSAHLADDGRDVDDPSPALLEHAAEDCLDEQERRAEVGREHVIPVGALHAEEQGVAGDAGVVDEDIDFTELGGNLLDRGADGVLGSHVEGKGGGLAAFGDDLGHHFLQLLFIARGQGHGCARFGQRDGAGAANSLGCSGNQRDVSL
jgi:hypothetical protein